MNIKKLFEMQKVLDERIIEEHKIRETYTKEQLIKSKVLSLNVETAECANEHREFKFWSKDREPRINAVCKTCNGAGQVRSANYPSTIAPCYVCNSTGQYGNPLLEEYVDGLHFVLSLGLEIDYENMEYFKWHKQKAHTITEQYIAIAKWAAAMLEDDYYFELFHAYIHLGVMLGFSWEQIEQAYMDKNKVNHQRQDNGY